MNLLLKLATCNQQSSIKITGSKSETNRLLLLQSLYPNLILENTSNSDDSEVMTKALLSNDSVIDIHHAGTAMRFLTAFFAIQENREVVLTGSSRMKERPIKILVDALRQLGAEINYEENEGFPPIKIKGKKVTQNKVSLPANVSSQYISALLLIAPKLENGLELTLQGEITSVPYIKMTLAMLNEIGVETSFENNKIIVKPQPQKPKPQTLSVESDWSSASYFYSIVALSEIGTQITLSSYKKDSLQGDSVLADIYKDFGVETTYENNKIQLRKGNNYQLSTINCQLNSSPDIAQTIAVTCFGLGLGCHLTGLHTLKIKETDRLLALKTELEKLGASVTISDESLTLEASSKINANIRIETYQDHRMAMAFAPLALNTNIIIEEAEVVSKSYPTFWEDLKCIGFNISEL
ncbi:3-phosphoshikimate 1-carboxyvinyltransferase [Flavobacterium paronense]|uniref:3-phosphoshikimate 1-carboxyvinyltransferase n=1 Tax=Flavobacterium paronense TaxID=1392775 RepID=A0ABV5GDN9_9FLAO|nr:3-phosphoshikimate 1-carboxyvinyltransferase [Flavobacterium paronense]MDN3678021.1 3-phosphoshikimate 1-carboxyvinyltransferase [Flavobacterium paronense]